MKKTGVFANGLIWFGAAVSIAEITTYKWIIRGNGQIRAGS